MPMIMELIIEEIYILNNSAILELPHSTPLMDFGLDSLAATQLVRVLGQKLGLQLPPTLLFDFPTVEQLSGHLATLLSGEDPSASTAALQPRTLIRSIDAAAEERHIAIVGMSCRFPGGLEGPGMLWEAVSAGRSVVGKVPLKGTPPQSRARSPGKLSSVTS